MFSVIMIRRINIMLLKQVIYYTHTNGGITNILIRYFFI